MHPPDLLTLCVTVTCALQPACNQHASIDPGPDLQITDESMILRSTDPIPRTSFYFNGAFAHFEGVRDERIGFLVYHREPATLHLAPKRADGLYSAAFDVQRVHVTHASTNLYGGGRGAGDYPDVLVANESPTTNPAFFEINIRKDAAPGDRLLTLTVGTRTIPVAVRVLPVSLEARISPVWAYYDPRELEWAGFGHGTVNEPSAEEQACISTVGDWAVLMSPDLPLSAWPARRHMLAGWSHIPVKLDVSHAADDVAGWIAATRGTLQVPFSIPIDEPRTAEARAKVKALAQTVRDAGGGPGRFQFAVTDEPHADYGDLIDLYITLAPKKADTYERWTYNGAPPRAGSLVVDARYPGPAMWGWLGFRWRIDVWYVWDALYWHDRHNRKGAPLPGRSLDATVDATSFNDGEDHGNLDGVLALPGDATTPCRPTLRLAGILRGQQDRVLLTQAVGCHAVETLALVDALIPRALGDAPKDGTASWSSDAATWAEARSKLRALAECK